MSIIDRVFPTGEHAACALQPLMHDLTNHPNAVILPSTELVSLQGQPGEFTAEVLRELPEGNGTSEKMELQCSLHPV